MESEPSPPTKRKHKQRFNRSKRGCLSCRRRRIRCDELHPTCERCKEAKIECVWPPEDPSSRSSRATSSALGNDAMQADVNDWPTEAKKGSQSDAVNTVEMDGMLQLMALPSDPAIGHSGVDRTSMSAHLPVAPLDSMPPAINSFPWTTTLLEGASWSHPTSIDASINLLDLLATDSNIASQVVSRQPTPPPFQTRPPRPPHSAESTAILSLSSSSNLASRRRATFPSALTVPVTIPATIEEPLEHVFPSAGSKRLFHHVKSQTSTIIVALGKGNHRDKNPFMAMATRLMRLNPTSHAQTAFRHSLLSLSSAHVAQQFNTSSPVQSQEMRVRTAKSKRKALVYLSLNSHTEGYTDLLLGTCLTLFLRNKLYADNMWRQSLECALGHILRCGGPAVLLSGANQHCDRRFLLEQIAVADLFSSFTTGEEPRLLGSGASWWNCTAATASGTEWESYERFLGISRDVTETLAVYRVIIARRKQLDAETWLQGKAASAARDSLVAQAKDMLGSLKQRSADRANTPARKRIKAGDLAYHYLMVISLSVEVIALDLVDPTVQAAVRSVLELCAETSQEPLNLIWPLLTAGSCALGEAQRSWARQLFTVLRESSRKDVDIARDLLDEQWTRIDCGSHFTPWPEIMKDLGVSVCFV